MKNLVLFLLAFTVFNGARAQEETSGHIQDVKKLPAVQLKDVNGKTFTTSELGFAGPVVISFWATWCAPCKRELNAIHEVYADWQEETGVNLVAVSIDDARSKSAVEMQVNGKSWEYLVLLDENSDFKRAMGVNNVPHTFLIDKDGNIVYSHNNYAAGDEDKLYEEIKKLTSK